MNRISIGAIASTIILSATIACHSGNSNSSATTLSDTARPVPPARISVMDLDTAQARRWADSVIATMSPDERIAQLFVTRLDINDDAAGYQKLKQYVKNHKVGGLLMGKGTLKIYGNVINQAQDYAQVPLLITLDGEWGLAMRVTDAPEFPVNIAFGAAADTALAADYGREVGRQCREIGIQVDFAPVLDVNSNPDNPVIGYRSFGADPKAVAELGRAYCRGMESTGVMSVGKHFPGHGDTNTDSHKALPTINHDLTTLRQVDFLPFVEAIDGGMSGVMVGHLKVPALDDSGTPSSMSKKITTDWLQDSLGFKGLIFTDALGMKGATATKENNCVAAFMAGADLLLNPSNLPVDLKAMKDAVKAGKITQEEVDRRCHKMLEYKYKLQAGKRRADVANIRKAMYSPEFERIALQTARKAVTLTRDSASLLPLDTAKTVAVVSLGAKASNEFADLTANNAKVTKYAVNGPGQLTQAVITKIRKADVVVIAIMANTDWSRQAFAKLSEIGKPTVGVFLMNPFKIKDFGKAVDRMQALMVCYDDIPQTRKAAAEALCGLIPVTGHLPADIPLAGKLGQGIQLPAKR